MTDEQIVRALECCGNMKECKKECPLGDVGGIDKCIHTLLLDALELIKRKDEELRRMRNAAEYYKEKTKALKNDEIDNLVKEMTEKEGGKG